MLRLFLSLVSFLGVSLAGLWYGLFQDRPFETTFENTSLTPVTEEMAAPKQGMIDEPVISPVPVIAPEADVLKSDIPPVLVATGGPTELEPVAVPELKNSPSVSIQSRLLRFGYRVPSASRSIDAIVLHSSYNASVGDEYDLEKTIAQYEQYGVGAHYIIDRKGAVYRLVEEANIAYHAGASKMPDGRKNVNDFSIGIEMIANMEDGYTEKQYAAVNALIADIKARYEIKGVVGHGDIAPSRKTDPWKFDWIKLK